MVRVLGLRKGGGKADSSGRSAGARSSSSIGSQQQIYKVHTAIRISASAAGRQKKQIVFMNVARDPDTSTPMFAHPLLLPPKGSTTHRLRRVAFFGVTRFFIWVGPQKHNKTSPSD